MRHGEPKQEVALLIAMLVKLNWFRLTSLVTLMLMVKMDESVLEKK